MLIEILEERIAPANVTVLNLNDSGPGSLRAAITTTNSAIDLPNQITFSPHLHGKILLKSALPDITRAVSITSPTPNQITIDGAHKFRIFDVATGGEVDLVDLKLTHGQGDVGGAINVQSGNGTVNVQHCFITGNEALGTSPQYADGGGIAIISGTLDLTSSKVTGNLALGQGGDISYAQGGGIYVGAGATLSIASSLISGNKAVGSKGLAALPGTNGVPGNSSTQGGTGSNGAEGTPSGSAYGGGIFNAGTLTVTGSTISRNKAVGGAGANGSKGGNGGAFGGNGGVGGNGGLGGIAIGGGISLGGSGSTTNVNSSTISGNSATGGAAGHAGAGGAAGAGSFHSGGKAVKGIKGQAGTAGPALDAGFVAGGGIGEQLPTASRTLNISESTVAKNDAREGGGIQLSNIITATIDNSTIAFNKATTGGSGLEWANPAMMGSVAVISTIVGQNSESAHVFDSSGISDYDVSLVQTADPTIGVTQPGGFENIIGHSAALAALRNNGGPTQTCLPSKHGLVIGSGANPNSDDSDQRGKARSDQGFTDIGAVQVS